ncbi:MAG: Trp biosynthesis-associated membrane protein [Nocardioidaceae bacterium]
MRRELAICLAIGLLGGGLVVLGAERPWGTTAATPGVPDSSVDPMGSLASSIGAVMLLGTIVVAVTRTVGRRLAGGVVTLASVAVGFVVVTSDGSWTGWRVTVLLGAVLGAAAGVLAIARGRRWTSMSQRYDAPTGPKPSHESDPWRALDRGDDPTV